MKHLKKFNENSKNILLYHGTNIHPRDFKLDPNYDGESGNVFMTDVPEGVVFLTTDLKEAKCYGKYVINCELKADNIKVYELQTNAPSRAFDDDFCGYGELGMYSEFVNGAYDALEVRGNSKSTFITYPECVIVLK